jgi:hypothetical protein
MPWFSLWWMLSGDDPQTNAAKVALGALADEARLQALAQELLPGLEERAGRRFLRVPRVRLLSRDDAVTTLRAEHAAVDPNLTDADLRAIGDKLYASLSTASGLYVGGLQEIVINRDALSRMSKGHDPEVVEALTRCVLGHELAHALQDQHLGLDAVPLPSDLKLLWAEGQAEWLSDEECPPAVQRAGASLPSLYDPKIKEDVWPYVFGAHAARLTAEVHGVEAIWAALAGGSPDRASMDTLLHTSLSPSWRDPAVLRPLLTPLERPSLGHPRESHLFPPSALGVFTPDEAPRLADPVLTESSGVANYQITLVRGRGAGATLGGAFLAARCRALDQGIKDRGDDLFILLAFTMTGYYGPGARLTRVETALKEGADAACAVKFNFATGHYYELWVSRGQQLAGGTLFARDVWAADLKKLTRAVQGALNLPMDDAAPDVSQHPAMLALKPTAAPVAEGFSPVYLERAFFIMARRGDEADCSLAEAVAERYGEFEALGAEARGYVYACALEVGDLTAAAAHLPPPEDVAITPVSLLIWHIKGLQDAGRAKEAKALAEGRCPLYAPTERSFCLAAAR